MAKIHWRSNPLEDEIKKTVKTAVRIGRIAMAAARVSLVSAFIVLFRSCHPVDHLPSLRGIIGFMALFFVFVAIKGVSGNYLREKLNRMETVKSGLEGEDKTIKVFSRLPDSCHVIPSVIASYGGGESQIDIVAVSPDGVFAIEVKNLNGAITGSVDDREWSQDKTGRGGGKYSKRFYSPVKQVGTHVYRLANILRQKGFKTRVEGIVYFSYEHTDVRVRGGGHVRVFSAGNGQTPAMLDYISGRNAKKKLSDTEIESVAKFIGGLPSHADGAEKHMEAPVRTQSRLSYQEWKDKNNLVPGNCYRTANSIDGLYRVGKGRLFHMKDEDTLVNMETGTEYGLLDEETFSNEPPGYGTPMWKYLSGLEFEGGYDRSGNRIKASHAIGGYDDYDGRDYGCGNEQECHELFSEPECDEPAPDAEPGYDSEEMDYYHRLSTMCDADGFLCGDGDIPDIRRYDSYPPAKDRLLRLDDMKPGRYYRAIDGSLVCGAGLIAYMRDSQTIVVCPKDARNIKGYCTASFAHAARDLREYGVYDLHNAIDPESGEGMMDGFWSYGEAMKDQPFIEISV